MLRHRSKGAASARKRASSPLTGDAGRGKSGKSAKRVASGGGVLGDKFTAEDSMRRKHKYCMIEKGDGTAGPTIKLDSRYWSCDPTRLAQVRSGHKQFDSMAHAMQEAREVCKDQGIELPVDLLFAIMEEWKDFDPALIGADGAADHLADHEGSAGGGGEAPDAGVGVGVSAVGLFAPSAPPAVSATTCDSLEALMPAPISKLWERRHVKWRTAFPNKLGPWVAAFYRFKRGSKSADDLFASGDKAMNADKRLCLLVDVIKDHFMSFPELIVGSHSFYIFAADVLALLPRARSAWLEHVLRIACNGKKSVLHDMQKHTTKEGKPSSPAKMAEALAAMLAAHKKEVGKPADIHPASEFALPAPMPAALEAIFAECVPEETAFEDQAPGLYPDRIHDFLQRLDDGRNKAIAADVLQHVPHAVNKFSKAFDFYAMIKREAADLHWNFPFESIDEEKEAAIGEGLIGGEARQNGQINDLLTRGITQSRMNNLYFNLGKQFMSRPSGDMEVSLWEQLLRMPSFIAKAVDPAEYKRQREQAGLDMPKGQQAFDHSGPAQGSTEAKLRLEQEITWLRVFMTMALRTARSARSKKLKDILTRHFAGFSWSRSTPGQAATFLGDNAVCVSAAWGPALHQYADCAMELAYLPAAPSTCSLTTSRLELITARGTRTTTSTMGAMHALDVLTEGSLTHEWMDMLMLVAEINMNGMQAGTECYAYECATGGIPVGEGDKKRRRIQEFFERLCAEANTGEIEDVNGAMIPAVIVSAVNEASTFESSHSTMIEFGNRLATIIAQGGALRKECPRPTPLEWVNEGKSRAAAFSSGDLSDESNLTESDDESTASEHELDVAAAEMATPTAKPRTTRTNPEDAAVQREVDAKLEDMMGKSIDEMITAATAAGASQSELRDALAHEGIEEQRRVLAFQIVISEAQESARKGEEWAGSATLEEAPPKRTRSAVSASREEEEIELCQPVPTKPTSPPAERVGGVRRSKPLRKRSKAECDNSKCTKPKREGRSGRMFDFCDLGCAEAYVEQEQVEGRPCPFPSCTRNVHCNPFTGDITIGCTRKHSTQISKYNKHCEEVGGESEFLMMESPDKNSGLCDMPGCGNKCKNAYCKHDHQVVHKVMVGAKAAMGLNPRAVVGAMHLAEFKAKSAKEAAVASPEASQQRGKAFEYAKAKLEQERVTAERSAAAIAALPRKLREAMARVPENFHEGMIAAAEELVKAHGDGWNAEDHRGYCSQSCPCCRSRVGEDFGYCEICDPKKTVRDQHDEPDDEPDEAGAPRVQGHSDAELAAIFARANSGASEIAANLQADVDQAAKDHPAPAWLEGCSNQSTIIVMTTYALQEHGGTLSTKQQDNIAAMCGLATAQMKDVVEWMQARTGAVAVATEARNAAAAAPTATSFADRAAAAAAAAARAAPSKSKAKGTATKADTGIKRFMSPAKAAAAATVPSKAKAPAPRPAPPPRAKATTWKKQAEAAANAAAKKKADEAASAAAAATLAALENEALSATAAAELKAKASANAAALRATRAAAAAAAARSASAPAMAAATAAAAAEAQHAARALADKGLLKSLTDAAKKSIDDQAALFRAEAREQQAKFARERAEMAEERSAAEEQRTLERAAWEKHAATQQVLLQEELRVARELAKTSAALARQEADRGAAAIRGEMKAGFKAVKAVASGGNAAATDLSATEISALEARHGAVAARAVMCNKANWERCKASRNPEVKITTSERKLRIVSEWQDVWDMKHLITRGIKTEESGSLPPDMMPLKLLLQQLTMLRRDQGKQLDNTVDELKTMKDLIECMAAAWCPHGIKAIINGSNNSSLASVTHAVQTRLRIARVSDADMQAALDKALATFENRINMWEGEHVAMLACAIADQTWKMLKRSANLTDSTSTTDDAVSGLAAVLAAGAAATTTAEAGSVIDGAETNFPKYMEASAEQAKALTVLQNQADRPEELNLVAAAGTSQEPAQVQAATDGLALSEDTTSRVILTNHFKAKMATNNPGISEVCGFNKARVHKAHRVMEKMNLEINDKMVITLAYAQFGYCPLFMFLPTTIGGARVTSDDKLSANQIMLALKCIGKVVKAMGWHELMPLEEFTEVVDTLELMQIQFQASYDTFGDDTVLDQFRSLCLSVFTQWAKCVHTYTVREGRLGRDYPTIGAVIELVGTLAAPSFMQVSHMLLAELQRRHQLHRFPVDKAGGASPAKATRANKTKIKEEGGGVSDIDTAPTQSDKTKASAKVQGVFTTPKGISVTRRMVYGYTSTCKSKKYFCYFDWARGDRGGCSDPGCEEVHVGGGTNTSPGHNEKTLATYKLRVDKESTEFFDKGGTILAKNMVNLPPSKNQIFSTNKSAGDRSDHGDKPKGKGTKANSKKGAKPDTSKGKGGGKKKD